ncbi:MAG: serine protease [Leptolyngbyaceae cyanobacterium bins.302]|nr:serine protease [Leptolyngbyaceae cyanobacterium bins.302]
MIGSALAFTACIGYWLTSTQALPTECVVPSQRTSVSVPRSLTQPRSLDILDQQARAITVKVKASYSNGSGILIQRRGQLYTVLTNRHVLTAGTPYVIQTPDGRSYPANLVKKINFQGDDLALLQFRSKTNYTIATLTSTHPLSQGDPLISAGFPLESAPTKANGLLITIGKVSLLPDKAFQGGYQIGYTNLIRQGMSGGPVLNLRGEVVGINSLHAYPLWGDPYIFRDGSKPPPAQRQTIVESSWAVPIDTFKQKVAGKR